MPLLCFAQDVKYNDGLYSIVFQTEKSIEEVYKNSREWIAINFKSANDVLQLDTKEKLIVKGSMSFNLYTGDYVFDYVGDLMLTISIREGRFKVDYEVTQVENIEYPGKKEIKNLTFIFYRDLSEEEVLNSKLEAFETAAIKEGWREKKINRTKENLIKGNSKDYQQLQRTRTEFESRIASTFISLEDYINSSKKDDDDW